MSIALYDFNWLKIISQMIPAIKQRHPMPTRLCRSNKMSPHESRPTENQQLH